MKNIKPNYFDTPNERRTKGDNFVNIMSYILGFSKPIKKVFKQIRKIDEKYEHEPIDSDIFKQDENE